MGSRGLRPIRPEDSGTAHKSVLPSRVDWKTYERPSGLHRPQHSAAAGFHPSRSLCTDVPSLATSHRDERSVLVSITVMRNRFPSGDHRIDDAVPGNSAIVLWPVPSLL